MNCASGCGNPAEDLPHGPYFCSPCNEARLDRISQNLERASACAKERERLGLRFGVIPPLSWEREQMMNEGREWRGPR